MKIWALSLFFTIFFAILSASAAQWDFGGDLAYEGYYYSQTLSPSTRTYDHVFYIKPKLDVKWSRKTAFYLKPNWRMNTSTTTSPEHLFFNLQEAYLDQKWSSLRFKIGPNIFNWGLLDGYSSMDVINGRTYFNPLQSEKRGAGAIHLTYTVNEDLKIEALYIPWQSRSYLPSADSRWLPRHFLLNSQMNNQTLILPEDFKYYYPGYAEMNRALYNNYGARVSYHVKSLDATIMFYEGASTSPPVQPQVDLNVISIDPQVAQVQSNVGLVPIYFRQQTAAAGFTYSWEKLILKLESTMAWSRNHSQNVPAGYWQNGLGAEIPIHSGETTWTLLAQIYRGKNNSPANNIASSTMRLFDNAGLFGFRVAPTTDWTATMFLITDFAHSGRYLSATTDYKFTDHWKAAVTIDIFDGPQESLFGTYKKNNRGIFRLTYIF